MNRRRTLPCLAAIAFLLAAAQASASATESPAAPGPGRLIRVPQDVATPRDAIGAAQPGDVILLAAGTYDGGLVVPKDKPDLTIRGVDRNAVVFDGKGYGLNAIEVEADRVTLENLSAHDFDGNGFYWEKVAGFTGRYLTVWNVNLYGIYATESRGGLFERSLVSGAADAAFYVGECQPCDTIVRNVEGRLSAIGYSGTNTGAGLELVDSTWDRNGTGILPNSFDEQALPAPESQSRIAGNTVRDSGTVPVPAHTPLAGFIGIGIGVAGGDANEIVDNTITGSARYGIALFATIQRSGATYWPSANRITANTVSGSGRADLAVAEWGGGDPSCFAGNRFGSSLPANVEAVLPCDGTPAGPSDPHGDPGVSADLSIPVPDALDRLAAAGPRPDYRSMPAPEAQPSSPDPLPSGRRSFRPEGPSLSIVAGAIVIAVALIVLIGLARRRRSGLRPG
jgi:hypothetical protein